MSYFSQMVRWLSQLFSAAVGIAIAAALVRGIAGALRRPSATSGWT